MKRTFAILVSVAVLLATTAGCARRTEQPAPVSIPATESQPAPGLAAAPKPAVVREAAPPLYPAYRFVKGQKNWGYIDGTGRFVIEPAFDIVDPFSPEGLAVVYRKGKFGLIDRSGKFILDLIYQTASQPSPTGEIIFYGEKDRTVIDAHGAVIVSSPELDSTFTGGLARIVRTSGDRRLFGYIDRSGAVVIEPQYQNAGDFQDGKAMVQVAAGLYALIDGTGKRVVEYAHPVVGQPSEGLINFQESNRKYGYLTLAGAVAIPAQFSEARPFAGGFAVVNTGADFGQRLFGLINHQGQFVIAAKYSYIEPLGAGLFAVAQPTERYVPEPFTPKALFTQEGKQLTEFQYFEMAKVDRDLIAVTDMTNSYFLDKTGAQAKGLPVVPGIGTLRLQGDLIAADVDQSLTYLTRDGKPVWQADRTVALAGGLKVLARKYRPDRLTLVYYPELTGLADQKIQAEINKQLAELFVPKPVKSGTDHQAELTVTYAAEQMGKLLVIRSDGYSYPLGAAHGMPSKTYYHIDLTTGARYALRDLFRPGAPYEARLTDWVQKAIAKSTEVYLNRKPVVAANQHFTVTPDGLVIYFHPYDIASYAQGFQFFTIPFDEIEDLINAEGAFWKSFKGG